MYIQWKIWNFDLFFVAGQFYFLAWLSSSDLQQRVRLGWILFMLKFQFLRWTDAMEKRKSDTRVFPAFKRWQYNFRVYAFDVVFFFFLRLEMQVVLGDKQQEWHHCYAPIYSHHNDDLRPGEASENNTTHFNVTKHQKKDRISVQNTYLR